MYETFYEPTEQDLKDYAECLKHYTIPKQIMQRYHEWLISNSSLEDFEHGVYRPYFWNFSLLTSCFRWR